MIELTFLKQQLRAKIVPFIIWIVVWSLLLLLFANVFNSLNKDAAESSKTFQQLPQGVFNAINIDPSTYLTRVEKFLSGQFLFVYLLAGSIFSFSLGTSAIGKKVENGTIASLLTKPISRSRIYLIQCLVSIVLLALAGLVIGGLSWFMFNSILQYQTDISSNYFIWLFLGSTLVFLTFAVLGQLIGTAINGGKSLQIGAGIIVVSWFISSLGEFANIPAVIQSLSVFHYFDISLLRDSYQLNNGLTVALILILISFVLVGGIVFRKKDIYV